jgi:hypothetical protein
VVSQAGSPYAMRFIFQPQGIPYTSTQVYNYDNSFMDTGQAIYSLDFGVLQGTSESFNVLGHLEITANVAKELAGLNLNYLYPGPNALTTPGTITQELTVSAWCPR